MEYSIMNCTISAKTTKPKGINRLWHCVSVIRVRSGVRMVSTLGKSTKNKESRALSETQILEAANLVRFNVIDYSIEHLISKVESGEYYVPEYQREFTWDKSKKSRFIESVMIGLPIPFVFFWQDEEGNFEIVDGSQRLRTLEEFVNRNFRLSKLSILTDSKGYTFKDFLESRRRKFLAQSIRGILLANDTSTSTRTEMFNRINTGGSKANEAEVRRGALPGPITDLIVELATHQSFIEMTPISKSLIDKREREELVVRFLAYTTRYDQGSDNQMFVGYKDKPREFIYEYLESANLVAEREPELIVELRTRFLNAIEFVSRVFPNGFQKPNLARQIPRARYESIAIGSALALIERPTLLQETPDISQWMDSDEFTTATTSDGANTKSRLQGRIKFVRDNLLGTVANG